MHLRWAIYPKLGQKKAGPIHFLSSELRNVSNLLFSGIFMLIVLDSLEEKQRAEKRIREDKGHNFTPRWFDLTEEVTSTPWGDLEIYKYNGKYTEHRVAIDNSGSSDDVDVKSIEFNPWQYDNQATN